MNFIDRIALGNRLAQQVIHLRGKDAVIVCLQESSLMTCLTMARELRAWIYPLIYVPLYSPDKAHRLLGALDAEGEFFAVPEAEKDSDEDDQSDNRLAAETQKLVHKQRPQALKALKDRLTAYGLRLDKHQLDGRDVILAGDVITGLLTFAAAQRLLNGAVPKSVTAVVGNATPEVAEQIRLSAGKSEIMDILSGIYHDENYYFERTDTYTDEQKHTITRHIAAYWE